MPLKETNIKRSKNQALHSSSRLVQSFTKTNEKYKNLVIFSICILVFSLLISGSIFFIKVRKDIANAASSTNNGANVTWNKKYSLDGVNWFNTVTAEVSQNVFVRILRTNTGTINVLNTTIKDTVNSNFTYKNGSFKNCLTPNLTDTDAVNPDISQITCNQNDTSNQLLMFNTLTGASGISPLAGLNGEAPNSTAGNLNVGQAGFMEYEINSKTAGNFSSRVTISSLPQTLASGQVISLFVSTGANVTINNIYTININTTISPCTSNINNLNPRDKFNCTFNLSGSPVGSYTIPPEGLYAGIRETAGIEASYLGNSSACSVSGTILTCNNIPTTGASPGSKEIVLNQLGIVFYPAKGSISIATKTYTPTTLSSFSCTEPIDNKITCSGQASGAPDIDTIYSGNITITLDNGGETATGDLASNGSFSIVVGVGTNNTNGNVTKVATASIGGNIVLGSSTANIVATSSIPPIVDPLFIPDTSLTISPNPSTGLSVFGDRDYTLVLKDDRMVANGSSASCTFRIKELTSPKDDDLNRGWNKLTSTILEVNNQPAINQGGYNTTTKLFDVKYNSQTEVGIPTTPGSSIKIAKDNQKYSDYDLEIRCTRTSDNQVFSRDERINFLFGAYAAVGITGVLV